MGGGRMSRREISGSNFFLGGHRQGGYSPGGNFCVRVLSKGELSGESSVVELTGHHVYTQSSTDGSVIKTLHIQTYDKLN